MRKPVKYLLFTISAVLIVLVVAVLLFVYGLMQDQPQLFSDPVFDHRPPVVDIDEGKKAVLVFSKTNAYRHHAAITAGNHFFKQQAKDNNWAVFVTENGAVFNSQLLTQFDVVVWNNVSGPVLNMEQRSALRQFIEHGGGFIGIHSAGDDSHAEWTWYQSQIIRARFIGHPMLPQLQNAVLRLENIRHPVLAGLPTSWQHKEEWYSFDRSPKSDATTILLSVDETTYSPGRNLLTGKALAMGADHPVMWSHQVGEGRVLYTALGHSAETFQLPWFQKILEQAVIWASPIDSHENKWQSEK